MEKVSNKAPHYSYMITPRDASVGGGWSLKLFEQGLEVGGGAFAAFEGEDEAQIYLDAMDEGESWLLAKAEHATGDDLQGGQVSAANPVVSEVDVQAEEARLYRDLTGDVMALGFDGLVAAVEELRRRLAAPADITIDKHLDAVLRASGSALRHYSLPKVLADMRSAMREAINVNANAAVNIREISQ